LRKQLLGRAQYNWDGWDDAATYLADQKTDLDEALKFEERSIQIEERFDNEMTKARILDLLNRKDEAAKSRTQAMAMGNAIQLHVYGRQLQQQGKQDEAFNVYRDNIKKNPGHWLVHNELARLAVAKGDYDTAVKEMRLAAAGATDQNKPAIEALVKRLEKKE